MKIRKIASLIIALFLVGCNTNSAPVPTRTQGMVALTFTPIPSYTVQATKTTLPLPASSSTFSPISTTPTEPYQSNCFQNATTQTEMNLCASQQAYEVAAKLKSLIDELQGHMSATHYTTLLKVETDWEKLIIEHCKWEANFFEGGSIQSVWYPGCLSQQYFYRIESLRLNLCEGNGITGECVESLKYKK
jgi:uncharacterized protein YecT (DUF1311 family)